MEHSYFKDRISAFIDGELPPYEEKVVKEHLADCEECRQIRAELEKIDSLVEKHSGLNEDEYWEKSAQKIESKLSLSDSLNEDAESKKESKYKGLGWKLVTVAASVAVLTFIGLHEKDIFKDIDDLPKMQAPSISPPPQTESREPDDMVLEEALTFDEVEQEEPSISKAAPSGKMEEIEKRDKKSSAERKGLEKPKIGIPSPVADDLVKPDEENKTVIGKGDSVTTIEDLLSKVAGKVTNTQGEVFIRGGRAGEVDYLVDSSPESKSENEVPDLVESEENTTVVNVEMEPRVTASDKTISVQGKQDQLEFYDTATKATITRETIEADLIEKENRTHKLRTYQSATTTIDSDISLEGISADIKRDEFKIIDSTQLLAEHINRRDSLLALWEKMSEVDKKLRIKSSVQKTNSIYVVEKQLLNSYYEVARLSKNRDEDQYNSAIEFLKEYAKDSQSRIPIDARNYLKRLDIIDY